MDFPGGLLYIWQMKCLSLILLTGLSACHFSSGNNNIKATTPDTMATAVNRIDDLLKLYTELKHDTVEIATAGNDSTNTWQYQGTLIDTSLLHLLTPDYIDRDPLYYACYKFYLDNNTIGLITRTPAEYESSSIKLFAYHKKTNTVTFETELADHWGDAGDALTKSSWLFRSAGSNWLGITEQYNYSEDPEDSTVPITETYDYYHFKWSGSKIDTTSTDSSALVEIFKKMAPVRIKPKA